jgi:hypothetical protein
MRWSRGLGRTVKTLLSEPVAVGMPVSRCPAQTPPAEYRMRLLSWMCGVEANARSGTERTWQRQPTGLEFAHSRPVQ